MISSQENSHVNIGFENHLDLKFAEIDKSMETKGDPIGFL